MNYSASHCGQAKKYTAPTADGAQISPKYLCMLSIALIRYTSGFVDDVMFAINGRNNLREEDVFSNWLTRGTWGSTGPGKV